MRAGAPLLSQNAKHVAHGHAALSEDPFVLGHDATRFRVFGNENHRPPRRQYQQPPLPSQAKRPLRRLGERESSRLADLNRGDVRQEGLTTNARLRRAGPGINSRPVLMPTIRISSAARSPG